VQCGKFTGTNGQCSNCVAGTFSDTVGAKCCTNCPVNTNSPAGSTICTACQSGFSSPAVRFPIFQRLVWMNLWNRILSRALPRAPQPVSQGNSWAAVHVPYALQGLSVQRVARHAVIALQIHTPPLRVPLVHRVLLASIVQRWDILFLLHQFRYLILYRAQPHALQTHRLVSQGNFWAEIHVLNVSQGLKVQPVARHAISAQQIHTLPPGVAPAPLATMAWVVLQCVVLVCRNFPHRLICLLWRVRVPAIQLRADNSVDVPDNSSWLAVNPDIWNVLLWPAPLASSVLMYETSSTRAVDAWS
jgi:hypothetical protein